EDEGDEDIKWSLLSHSCQCRQDDLLWVPAKHLDNWRARHRLLIEDALDHRRFEDAEADPQPDSDHDDADPERHAPAPVQKLIAGNRAEYEDGDIRDEQSGRSTPLRPRGDEAAMGICLRPLHRDQGRAAPLAADGSTLRSVRLSVRGACTGYRQ